MDILQKEDKCNKCHCHNGGSSCCGHEDKSFDDKKEFTRLLVAAFLFLAGFFIYREVFHITAFIIAGFDVLISSIKRLVKGHAFDETVLMSIACVGAVLVGEYSEAVMVMLLWKVGEILQERAVFKSKKSLSKLLEIAPEFANLVFENKVLRVNPEQVKCGDIILVGKGEKIPLDGVVVSGSAYLDMSAITGESVPVFKKEDDEVLSGAINSDGALKIRATKTYENSTVAKIIRLTKEASLNKSTNEKFISKFAKVYTPIVVILAVFTAVIASIIFGDFKTWIYRALIFLVISCPCALVISVPLSYFAGIGKCARQGILVKGSNFIDALADIKTVIFDKTGTLTEGKFKVREADDDVLRLSAYAEAYSNHPIANAIKEAYGGEIKTEKIKDVKEFTGCGVKALVSGEEILVGNIALMRKFGVEVKEEKNAVYVAKNRQYAGRILIYDKIKEDSKNAVSKLSKLGIKIVMLTGDEKYKAKSVSEELGICDYYANLIPDGKVLKIKEAGDCAFVGDGINDAPAIAASKVGIAMGALGADSAIAAADVVLAGDEPSKVYEAILISKKTLATIKQNLVFILGIKILFMILAVFGISNMWTAIFADVGVSILTVINSVRGQH